MNATHLISLTFDDALDVHLDLAAPLLEQYGFRGTFYVTAGAPSFTGRLDDWRRVAAAGHELGNHTRLHPAWRRKSYVTEANAIERYTLDRMRLELESVNQVLAGLDGRADRTFAYPCSNPVLGRPGLAGRLLAALGRPNTRLARPLGRYRWLDPGSTLASYEPLVAALFAAGRGGGNHFSAGPGFPPRRGWVPAVSLDGGDGAALAAMLEQFLATPRGWLVFMGHGLGGGHRLSCEVPVLEGLLATLRQRALTVLPLREAARRVFGT